MLAKTLLAALAALDVLAIDVGPGDTVDGAGLAPDTIGLEVD